MKIIAVDTNLHSLSTLTDCLKQVFPEGDIESFFDPLSAVQYGFNHKIDAVFTEIPMRGVDGFTLVKLVRQHNRQMSVYFVTSAAEYADEASLFQADGFLMKPVTFEKIKSNLIV